MKPISIARANVKRMIRERSNIFFVFIFPIAIILLIGVQFGGGVDPVLGLYAEDDGQIAVSITDALEAEDSIAITRFDSEDDVVGAVEQGNVQAGVFLPAGMDAAAAEDVVVEIGYLATQDGSGAQLQTFVGSIVADVMMPVGAAQYAIGESGDSFETAFAVSTSLEDQVSGPVVEVSAVGEAIFPDSLGRFDLGAASQLVLFVFLTALTSSAALILTRQLGISSRMLSTPTPVGSIVLGESLGRFGVGLLQGLYIIGLTLIIFNVNWGDPIGAALILVALSAVGAGAGMLLGATFNNDQQASAVSPMIGIGLAALGGCMFPLELFSPTMQKVAHITPHAWALDGFAELVRRGGGPLDILPELGVLTLFAVVLLTLAGWRLRVAITRP